MGGRVYPGVIFAAIIVLGAPLFAREHAPPPGPPFQTVLDIETTARLLAVLLDSGRAVINENQERFSGKGAKGLPPALFEQQVTDVFRSRSGLDLHELGESRLPDQAKRLLPLFLSTSKDVVARFQTGDAGTAGLIPAVFGSLVAGRFSELTGVRLKQTSLSPRNPANSPDAFEKAMLELFADPSHPREQPVSEIKAKGGSLRLMYPLYTTRQCLACHGGPKGEPDKTGYPREGLELGQNAGAISIVIPLHK
jgi:general secretion pathway protein A